MTAVPIVAATYDTSKHPHNPAGPGGGQFSTTNTPVPRGKLTYTGKPQGNKRGGGGSGTTVAAKPTLAKGRLKRGADNDPAAVTQLQNLINELKLGGIKVDGVFGESTEAAVKAIQAKLGLKPTGIASAALVNRLHDAHTLSPCVDKSASAVIAAAGHDVTPGHDELHHWWVFGEGRTRWHTWTELRDQLVEHVGPVKAAVFASAWFHERYGIWSGSDLNRVKNGKPPRGKVVGPG